LQHEIGNDTVENGSLETKTLFAGAAVDEINQINMHGQVSIALSKRNQE
jgi:hypothetical protein